MALYVASAERWRSDWEQITIVIFSNKREWLRKARKFEAIGQIKGEVGCVSAGLRDHQRQPVDSSGSAQWSLFKGLDARRPAGPE